MLFCKLNTQIRKIARSPLRIIGEYFRDIIIGYLILESLSENKKLADKLQLDSFQQALELEDHT